MIYDAVIIGAGTSGSYLAKKLADKGLNVCVVEKENEIGKPVQCTGLFTNKIKYFVDINNDFLLNKLNKVVLNCKGNKVKIDSEEFVVDRTKFDKYLFNKAKKSGVKYLLNSSFNGYKVNSNGSLRIKINKNRFIDSFRVIGCDGPLSSVNKIFKLNKDNRCFFAKQFVINTNSKIDKYEYNVFFEDFFSDFFGWSVPCSNNCLRIGLGSSDFTIVNNRLDEFKKKFKGRVVEVNAGLIPIYNPNRRLFKKIKKSVVYLIGDAGSIVKATSGGGIVPSFSMINECYNDIINFKKLRFPKTKFELIIHLLIHKLIIKFKNKDFNDLINDLKDDKLKEIISNINRDNIIKLLFKIILRKPKYLGFILKFI